MADSDARSTGMLLAFGALTCLMMLLFMPAVATAQDADEELILEEDVIGEEAPAKKKSGLFGGLKAILKRDKPGDAAGPAGEGEDVEDVIEPADVPKAAADVPAAPAAVDEDGKGVAGLPVSVCSAATQQHWRMFVHYFRLARFDLSVEEGQKVLDANVDPKVMLTLAETRTTGYDTLVQMMTVDEMGDAPSRVLTLVDKGMYERRTDPVRIAKNLERLARGPRAYFLALRELKRSGPYVVPHALAMLQDPASQDKLTPSLVRGLIEIGRPVVLPLTYALATKDQNLKQTICDVLGPIGYQYALPALKAVVENKSVSEVTRKAATKAIKDISGDTTVLKTRSKVLYLELARKYHNREISGIADSRLPKTDIFGWDAVKGLTYKAVPTSIVGEVLCGRACVDALKADPSALDAVALWMASQMRIKAKLPDATVKDSNPFSPAGMPEVEFFALALGEQYLCEVLSGALKERDVVVALQAIEALEKVADERFLRSYGQSDVVSPLVEAVSYPDRRVRFAAAFALAEVQPKKPFRGSQKVVPALAEALNLGTGKSLLLAESESDNRNQLKNALEGAGYRVVAVDTGKAAVESAETMPRLDVVLLSSRIKIADYGEVIKILRNAYATELTPIVVLSWPDDPFKASDLKAKFKYLDVVDADSELAEVEKTIKDLAAAVGAMTFEDEIAEALSIRAVTVLKTIAATNTVYEARGARQVLLDALSDRPDGLTILALAALAEIADPEITREIATVATGADTAAEVRLAALSSLTRAIRFAGNHLTPATVEQLRKMTAEDDNKLRNAVATVLGALNLPPEDGAKIILQYGAR